jgi:hypothetical protein
VAIRYIRQKDLNYLLWDRCISNSLNGLIYAYSWYLDIVAEHWDALVEDDYRSVMPLVYKYKSGYKKVYTPFLSKQLGIFSVKPLIEPKIIQYINLIPKTFKKISICLNRQNCQSMKSQNNYTVLRAFEMDLIMSYEKKSRMYSIVVRDGLSIAHDKKLQVIKGISISDMEVFIRQHEPYYAESVLLKPLQQILSQLINSGKAEIIGVYSCTNILVSLACFMRSSQNVIMVYALTSKQGEEEKANYLLIDSFLKSYSSRNITLSLDHFNENWNPQLYQDFGALESNYFCLNENRLPFFLKWL